MQIVSRLFCLFFRTFALNPFVTDGTSRSIFLIPTKQFVFTITVTNVENVQRFSSLPPSVLVKRLFGCDFPLITKQNPVYRIFRRARDQRPGPN